MGEGYPLLKSGKRERFYVGIGEKLTWGNGIEEIKSEIGFVLQL